MPGDEGAEGREVKRGDGEWDAKKHKSKRLQHIISK